MGYPNNNDTTKTYAANFENVGMEGWKVKNPVNVVYGCPPIS